MYNFKDLVKRYGKTITLINEAEGHYDYNDGGTWVPGQKQEEDVTAAILSISQKDLNDLNAQYGEGGVYTTDDKKLYIHQDLSIGQIIKDEGKNYTIDKEADYSYHANGLRIYYARRATNEL